jgi:hypothetical protein
MASPSSDLTTALADRYRLERELGSGGMATVYLARDLKHDRDVAVKVLRPELSAMLGADRFLNEIRISARLDHPHILTLIDSGAADGFLYYVMPFVRGESLRSKLTRERQLGLGETLDIARQIGSALDYAHRQGVVHRDIKPENILLHEGEAVLADFGIAMAVEEAGGNRLTESGMSLGTPQYMSPEQAVGERQLDARSDVYSIAAVVYEMLAGEPPHSGASMQAIIAKLLTERPTRLRVLRDTVPEEVDAAVSRALAKTPVDRFASAGAFAQALATPASGAARRWSTVTRRWAPLAFGAAIVAGGVAALLFAREPIPPPLPDRVQLTLTGNAISPSLSPDGTRFAFAEKQCDSAGSCTYQLVIQDQDGAGRLVLTRDIGYIYKTQWTSDGRFLAFAGSHPPLRHGAFAVSTLGGETRFLGSGAFDLMSGDTALLQGGAPPGADRWWARRVTIRDGRIVDSIVVNDAGTSHYIAGLTIPDRIVIATRERGEIDGELRLADFRGGVIDRFTPPFASHGRSFTVRWVPSGQRLVIAAQRELGGSEFDVLAMKLTASAIDRAVDTVLSGVELGNGIFDVSTDGERLVYFGGPVEAALSTIGVEPGANAGLTAKDRLSSTALLRGRISPAGDRILLARDARRGGAHSSQLSLAPLAGETESQIPGVVEHLLDFQWSPDGRRILYLHAIAGGKLQLMETDASGSATRQIARLEQAAAIHFRPLPDGAVLLLPPERRSLSIIGRPGRPDVTWPVPEWIGGIGGISHGADATSVLVAAMNGTGDSVVVATVDIETGRFTRLASFAGSDPQFVGQIEDGSVVSVVREPKGAWAFHRIRPGRRSELLGTLPHSRAEFSVSRDGRRVVLIRYTDRNDVHMIRNFGSMLRR